MMTRTYFIPVMVWIIVMASFTGTGDSCVFMKLTGSPWADLKSQYHCNLSWTSIIAPKWCCCCRCPRFLPESKDAVAYGGVYTLKWLKNTHIQWHPNRTKSGKISTQEHLIWYFKVPSNTETSRLLLIIQVQQKQSSWRLITLCTIHFHKCVHSLQHRLVWMICLFISNKLVNVSLHTEMPLFFSSLKHCVTVSARQLSHTSFRVSAGIRLDPRAVTEGLLLLMDYQSLILAYDTAWEFPR